MNLLFYPRPCSYLMSSHLLRRLRCVFKPLTESIFRSPIVSVLADKYGKRPQFLFASIFGVLGTGICIAGFDQASYTRSYRVLLAGRMVQGLGTTAYESLAVAAVGDTFFLHRRGLRTSLLVLTTACLASFVAICAGHMFEAHGARNLFVVLLPLQLFGCLATFLFVPETQFRRAILRPTSLQNVGTPGKDMENPQEATLRDIPPDPTSNTAPKRSFVHDLQVFSGVYNQESIPRLLSRIFVHFLNPAIVWIMLVAAILIVCTLQWPALSRNQAHLSQSLFVGTAYTLAQIFTPAPYHLSVSQNGSFFTGALVGGLLATSAGPLCDFLARALARRNAGIFEPEFRVPIFILAAISSVLGWFVFAWTLRRPTFRGGVYLCSFCYGSVAFGTGVAGTGAGLYIL